MAVRFDVSREIEAPPERVFDAMVDLEGAGAWMPGLVAMKLLDDGPVCAGSRWRETRKMFGSEATEEFEVVTFERPRVLGLRVDGSKGSSGRGEFLFEYRLEPTERGTDVALVGEIRGLGGIPGFLGRLMVIPYRKACAKDLDALAEHLEAEG